jgi:cytidylate kinase
MAVITVSRQFGSGGDEIAARVCEILGYGYFDKKLMARVANEVGLSEGEIVDLSEDDYRVRSFMDRLLRRSPSGSAQVRSWREDTSGVRMPDVKALDEDQAVALVRASVEAAYRQGDIVIVGRGGQAVLQDKPGALHVRIEAPFEVRAQRVAEQERIVPSAAQDLVADRDKATAGYLRRFHDIDWDDPRLYHLMVNTAKWDVEAAARIIANAAGCLPAA